MTVLSRYLSREIARLFVVILVMVIGVYVAVDFFEKIDDFIEAGLPAAKVLRFFINKVPFIVSQITPVGILLAVLVVFGMMNRNNEIVALKSNGISVYSLVKPVAVIGVLLSVLLFFVSEAVVPVTMATANRIWLQEVRNQRIVVSREKNIWLKGDRQIVHIVHFDPGKKAVFGVSVYRFDDRFSLVWRLDAEKGSYAGGRWIFESVMVQVRSPDGTGYSSRFHARKAEDLGIVPEDLTRVVKKSEEMNFKELARYIEKIEAEGYDATSYRVDLHGKFALPFVCIIMCLVGAGIGMRGAVNDGLPVSITYGIGIAFVYWVSFSFCMSLGYGEMLPPFVAAWTADFIFFCVGLLWLLNAE